MQEPTTPQSLNILNQHCLLEIFKFLPIEDILSVAETCTYLGSVTDNIFKKYSEFQLDWSICNKGKNAIDRILFHIGHHVSSLTIESSPVKGFSLNDVITSCKNLKSINIKNLVVAWENISYSCNVERLTLDSCHLISFQENYHKLKAFNCFHTSMDVDLKTIFVSNSNIESFLYCSGKRRFDFALLELIPKVEKLGLPSKNFNSDDVSMLNFVLKLEHLKQLYLNCGAVSITSFLDELARKEMLEELELEFVNIDATFFNTLSLFGELRLLSVLSSHCRPLYNPYWNLSSSLVLPRKLTHLKLTFFIFTYKAFTSMIEQLNYLKVIDLWNCEINKEDEPNFKNIQTLSRHIQDIITDDRKQRLDVVLPRKMDYEDNKKIQFYSKQLRILSSPLEAICVHFPGLRRDK